MKLKVTAGPPEKLSIDTPGELKPGILYLGFCGQSLQDSYVEIAKKNVDKQIARILRDVGQEGWSFCTFKLNQAQITALEEVAKSDLENSIQRWEVLVADAGNIDEYVDETKVSNEAKEFIRSIHLTEINLDDED
jgi:hypothetical protein